MTAETKPQNFIREIIDGDRAIGKHGGQVVTRFPPEPNGYLHIGHAKSICLNFGLALDYGGRCHLRYDDTNPTKESDEYVRSIQEDIKWLGFDWAQHLYYASSYFQQLYDFAVELIRRGKAFVCQLNADQMRQYRGTLTDPGKPSPWRERSVAENLTLFESMRRGELPEGEYVLRAKIDMASPNINMRDPVLYRILKADHHRTGSQWCIYPMYDYAHPLSDMIEGITHSICTLEFENHRPLYDWLLTALETKCHPQQIEFARLNISHTVMSKRKLLELVQQKSVSGWNDPRMPTISGLRRRGFTAASIRNFCERIGVAKRESEVDHGLLEFCVREELNKTAPRAMAVLNPIKVVIENYPEGQTETVDAVNNPEDPTAGTRPVPFGRELYIEADDFMQNPPKDFFRLAPGVEVRFKYAYFIRCREAVCDASGNVLELRCTYDPASRGGKSPDGRKVKGTITWVPATHAAKAEVRRYDHLFMTEAEPGPDGETVTRLNPASLKVVNAWIEPSLATVAVGSTFQFERLGYFCVDPDSKPGLPVFNRTVTLKDSWKKGA